jgi:hypothetical protein
MNRQEEKPKPEPLPKGVRTIQDVLAQIFSEEGMKDEKAD